LLEKLFCDNLFPFKFSVAVDTFYFPLPSWHRLKNRKVGTLNLVLNNPTEKRTLRCARTMSEARWLSTIEHLPHSSEVWHCIHIPAVAVSKEPRTSLGLTWSCFLLWWHICGTYCIYHIVYIMNTPWIPQRCLFNYTCMQQSVWQNFSCKHWS